MAALHGNEIARPRLELQRQRLQLSARQAEATRRVAESRMSPRTDFENASKFSPAFRPAPPASAGPASACDPPRPPASARTVPPGDPGWESGLGSLGWKPDSGVVGWEPGVTGGPPTPSRDFPRIPRVLPPPRRECDQPAAPGGTLRWRGCCLNYPITRSRNYPIMGPPRPPASAARAMPVFRCAGRGPEGAAGKLALRRREKHEESV
jgi:hypothetical protein